MPNDSDSFKATLLPANSNTEETPAGSGLFLTKVRWLEQADPVYYLVDDQPIMDLYNRDIQLASQIQANLGGWFHQHVPANQLSNDTTIPYTVGTIDNMIASADFPSTVNAKSYFQTTTARNINVNSDLYIKLQYAMSTSDTSKNVALTFRYDYYEVDDVFGSPSATNTLITTIVPPDTMNQYQSYTDTILKVPASDITNSFQYMAFSLERDVTVASNHGGKFQLVGVTLYQ